MRCLLLAASVCAAQETLTLADAEATALKNHPRIASLALQAKAAAEAVTQAKAPLYPVMSVNLTGVGAERGSAVAAGNITTSSLASRAAGGMVLNQLITDFGRTGFLATSAQLRAGAKEKDVAVSRAQVLLRVRQTYYRALAGEAVLKIARETVEARKVTLRLVTALANSNLKSTLDVSFAEVAVSEADLALYRAENDAKASRAELAAAMGLQEEKAFALRDEPLPVTLELPAEEWTARGIKERPELAALQLQRDAAARFADAEKRLRLPSLYALGVAGAIPAREEKLKGTYAAAGLNLSIPIFNGSLYSSRQKEASFKALAAEKDVRELEVSIARSIRIAYLNARTGERRMDVTARLIEQAARALKLAQSRYELGLSSIVELTQAQLSKTGADIENAAARYEYQIQRAQLDFEAGAVQ